MGTGSSGASKALGAHTGAYADGGALPAGARELLDELEEVRKQLAGDYSGIGNPYNHMDIEEALEHSPAGSSDKAALIYELRREGLDVVDNPRVTGGAFTAFGEAEGGKLGSYKEVGRLVRESEPGARWALRLPMKQKGAQPRTVVLEVMAGRGGQNTFRLVDPQSGQSSVRWLNQINRDAEVPAIRMDTAGKRNLIKGSLSQGDRSLVRPRNTTQLKTREREIVSALGRMGLGR